MRYLLLLLMLFAVASAFDFSYTLNMDQIKETSKLTNSFSVAEVVSPTVNINGNGTFSAERTEGLDRFTDYRSGTGILSWKPINGVEMSTTFLQSISLEDRYSERVRDDRTSSASGSLRYSRGNWLNTSVSVGLQNTDYVRTSGDTLTSGNNDGNFYRVGATVTKTLFSGINTSLGFNESRSYGNETENFSDGLNARMNYYFPESFRGGSLSAQITAAQNTINYIDSLQTRVGESWGHSESAELPEIIPGVFINFSTGWTDDNDHYKYTDPDSTIDDPRNNDRFGRYLGSNLVWEAAENIELDFSLDRTYNNQENTTRIYGTTDYYQLNEFTDDKLLNITLSYTPGDSRITFQRLVELYSYDTEVENADTLMYTNDYDRDEYRELISISASIPMSERFTLTCSMNGQERSLYYLMSSQSANSKRTSTYAFNPGYRYDLGNDWKLSQSMKITATYTNYLFPEQSGISDRLFRRLDESFTLSRTSTDSTTLGISHNFIFNDQGNIEDGLFLRTEETLNNTITLDVGFHVSSSVGITPTYSYQYYARNRMAYGLKTVDHIHHVGIRSAIDAMGGTLNTNITRSFYSDDDRDSYWNANVGFNIRM